MPDAIVTTVVGSETIVQAGDADNTLVTSVVQQPPVDVAQTLVFLGGSTAPGMVPNGGLAGQSLTKRSNADGDYGWDIPSPIDGGTFN